MDFSVYLLTATVATFTVGAAAALWISIVTGQWNSRDHAALIVLEHDDPMPTRAEGAR